MHSQFNIYKQYQKVSVNTTDQGRLILICYDCAIMNCEQAKEALERKDFLGKARKLYRAQDAITELMCALNFEKGGIIAKNLYRLYEYMNWRLSEANLRKNIPMIEEVLRHLRSLREAWLQAIENVRRDKEGIKAKADGGEPLSLVG